MLTTYTGNGAYCYANSLHMSLLAAGADPHTLPGPGMLECLTTMPFGKLLFRTDYAQGFFPSGPDVNPDTGLDRALDYLGWTCASWHGGDATEAIARLREAVQTGPVLLGPVDMVHLTYNPAHAQMAGGDHFVVALAVDATMVTVHDPAGWPYTHLPITDLLNAWRADKLEYGDRPYHMRWAFRQAERRDPAEVIARALPAIAATIAADPQGAAIWGPGAPGVYGGARALRELAHALRGDGANHLAPGLIWFALPLAARRLNDAAHFLTEAGLPDAAHRLAEQARLFGAAQYPAVTQDWPTVATLMDQAATLQTALADAFTPTPA